MIRSVLVNAPYTLENSMCGYIVEGSVSYMSISVKEGNVTIEAEVGVM